MRRRSGFFDVDRRTARFLERWMPRAVVRAVAKSARTVDARSLEEPATFVDLALAGVCLVGGPVNAAAPAPLARLIDSGVPSSAAERERRSILVRQSVATSPPPAIGVVMATKRPWALENALDLIGRQAGVDVEVVLGLHGDDWGEWSDAQIAETCRWPVTTVRLPASTSFGHVLEIASSRSSADVITKWDDDDWYGNHHLRDLVDALAYSGATIVGKAAEFVYLGASDTTIRRDARGGERFSSALAGGTLMIRRDDLDAVGGWPDVRRHVDVGLLRAVHRSGGSSYRTHGLDYMLERRPPEAADHTWSADDRYFLDAAMCSWQGRRTDVAAVDPQ